MKTKLLASIAAAAALFSGCAVDDYSLRQPSGLVEAPALSERAWYEDFADARLSELIALALTNNEDIKIAANNLAIAQSYLSSARISEWPHVDASASAGISKPRRGDRSENYSLGAHLSWQLDFWGKLRNETAKAASSVQQSELSLQQARDIIAFSVARLYFQVAAAAKEEQILGEFSKLQGEQLKIFEQQFKLGAISKTSFSKLKSDYEKLLIRQASASARAATLGKALGALVSQLDERREIRVGIELPSVQPPKLYLSTQLLARPDIASAALEVKKRHLDAKIARASFLPSFSLSLGVTAAGSHDIFDNPVTSLGASLLQPLFNLAANKNALKRANLEQSSAVLRYEKALKNAIVELHKTAIDYRSNSENLERFSSVIALEREIFNTAKMRYEIGETSLLDYLDAKRALLSSELEANNLALARLLSVINLYDASGIRFVEK